MSHSHNQESHTLKGKVFDSSLKWNIVNFKEYSKRDIGSIASHKVQIEGTEVHWILHVHPHGYHSPMKYDYEDIYSSSAYKDDNYVSLSLQIKCKKPSHNQCFKIEVKTDVPHDLDEHVTAQIKPIAWRVECKNIDSKTHIELYNENFIRGYDLHNFLFDGSFILKAKVSMKYLNDCDWNDAD